MAKENLEFRQEAYYLLRSAGRLLAFTKGLSTEDYTFLSERIDDCVILLEKQRTQWEPDTKKADKIAS